MTQRVKPIHEFRLGRVKATIWANQTNSGDVWFNVGIVRLYWEDDKWFESTNFGRDDLPLVAKAADMAFAWIWSQSTGALLESNQHHSGPKLNRRPPPESS